MFAILHTPHDLAPWVRCIWTMRGEASVAAEVPIAPDGCCEWIVHLGDPPRVLRDGTWTRQPRMFVFGQLQGPLVLHNDRPAHVLAVRLHAHAAAALLGTAGRALLPTELSIPDLLRAAPTRRWIGEFSALQPAYRHMLALLRGLASRARPFDPLALAATAAIDRAPADARIDVLSRQLAVSPRTLERRFVDAVGLAPKRYARIRRMQACLDVLATARHSLAQAAALAGFADQAHMTRELVELAGCRPGERVVGA